MPDRVETTQPTPEQLEAAWAEAQGIADATTSEQPVREIASLRVTFVGINANRASFTSRFDQPFVIDVCPLLASELVVGHQVDIVALVCRVQGRIVSGHVVEVYTIDPDVDAVAQFVAALAGIADDWPLDTAGIRQRLDAAWGDAP